MNWNGGGVWLHTAPLRYRRCRRNRGGINSKGAACGFHAGPRRRRRNGRHVCAILPPCRRRGLRGTTTYPVVVPGTCHLIPPAVTKTLGNDDEQVVAVVPLHILSPPLLAFLPIIPSSLLMSPVAGTFGRDVAPDVVVIRIVIVCR